jgi:para-aminobenzoate synthetase/4-amino-4-deoxychorismate lyase
MQFVYFEDQLTGRHRLYEHPVKRITAYDLGDLPRAFRDIKQARTQGYYLAGYMDYECGFYAEPVLRKLFKKNMDAPLLDFGVFKNCAHDQVLAPSYGSIDDLTPIWTEAQYARRFAKVHDYIRAGDVYQINLSFPLHGQSTGSAAGLYHTLKQAQPVRYGGVVNLGNDTVISLSPELFFTRTEDYIKMRPMKGTARRGRTPAQDKHNAQHLQKDEKNRAENLMIVDLLRNDLSRISRSGSVHVSDLFTLETYPSLHTLTSGIEAELNKDVDFENIIRALFPCGSITGAPKIRAQEIIDELETHRRGAYCGAMGWVDPDGQMSFNVGIRTLTLKQDGRFVYPVGSGIVADSDMDGEYAECLLKASFLEHTYGLIETFGWDPQTGFMHKELHIERLMLSAQALGFSHDETKIMTALNRAVQGLDHPHKIRLVLAKTGAFEIEATPLVFQEVGIWNISVCKTPRSSRDPLCRHKTTRRSFLEDEHARVASISGAREVIFINENNQICEGSFTNVFVKKDGVLYTPPLSCGVLPGIFRAVLLANGEAQERVLTPDDVYSADALYVGNSLRGLIPATLTHTQAL